MEFLIRAKKRECDIWWPIIYMYAFLKSIYTGGSKHWIRVYFCASVAYSEDASILGLDIMECLVVFGILLSTRSRV